jgi:hypothetical protein
MTLVSLTRYIEAPRLTPVGARHAPLFCFALLVTASCLASFALACATPFAAFAVIAAMMLPLRPALAVVAGTWLVNQGIGFCVQHYPIDANTMLWGLAIGAAALAATVMVAIVLPMLRHIRAALALATALLAAYAVYELALFAVTPILGGATGFTLAIVGRLGLINAAWLIGLVAARELIWRSAPVQRAA